MVFYPLDKRLKVCYAIYRLRRAEMREITGLPRKVELGLVGVETLLKMLAAERKFAQPVVTMRTLGTFSADYETRQATAEQELEESRLTALRNIPIIEGLLIQLGASIETPKPVLLKPNGYFSNENVEDGDGFGL